MNKNIYKKVWNTSRGCLVAVEETKTSKGKAKTAAVLIASVFLIPSLSYAVTAPTYPSYVIPTDAQTYKATQNVVINNYSTAEEMEGLWGVKVSTFVNGYSSNMMNYNGLRFDGSFKFIGQSFDHYLYLNSNIPFPKNGKDSSGNYRRMDLKKIEFTGDATFSTAETFIDHDGHLGDTVYVVQAAARAGSALNLLKVGGTMKLEANLGHLRYFMAIPTLREGSLAESYVEARDLIVGNKTYFFIVSDEAGDSDQKRATGKLTVFNKITVQEGGYLQNLNETRSSNSDVAQLQAKAMDVSGTYVQSRYYKNADYASFVESDLTVNSTGSAYFQGDLLIGSSGLTKKNFTVGSAVNVKNGGKLYFGWDRKSYDPAEKAIKITGNGLFNYEGGELDLRGVDVSVNTVTGRGISTGGALQLDRLDLNGDLTILDGGSVSAKVVQENSYDEATVVKIRGGSITNYGTLELTGLSYVGTGSSTDGHIKITGGTLNSLGGSATIRYADIDSGTFTINSEAGATDFEHTFIKGTLNLNAKDYPSEAPSFDDLTLNGGTINHNSGLAFIEDLVMPSGTIRVNEKAEDHPEAEMRLTMPHITGGTIVNNAVLKISQPNFENNVSQINSTGDLYLDRVTNTNAKISVTGGTLRIEDFGSTFSSTQDALTTTNSNVSIKNADIYVSQNWLNWGNITVFTDHSMNVSGDPPRADGKSRRVTVTIKGESTGILTVQEDATLTINPYAQVVPIALSSSGNVNNKGTITLNGYRSLDGVARSLMVKGGVFKNASNTASVVANSTVNFAGGQFINGTSQRETGKTGALLQSDWGDISLGSITTNYGTIESTKAAIILTGTATNYGDLKGYTYVLNETDNTYTGMAGSTIVSENYITNKGTIQNSGTITAKTGGFGNTAGSVFENVTNDSSLTATYVIIKDTSTFKNHGTVNLTTGDPNNPHLNVNNEGVLKTHWHFYFNKGLENRKEFVNSGELGVFQPSGEPDQRTTASYISNGAGADFKNSLGKINVYYISNQGKFTNTGSINLAGALDINKGGIFTMQSVGEHSVYAGTRVLLTNAGSKLDILSGTITTPKLENTDGFVTISGGELHTNIWDIGTGASRAESTVAISGTGKFSMLYKSDDAALPSAGANTLFKEAGKDQIKFSYVKNGDGGLIFRDATATEYYDRVKAGLSDDARLDKLSFSGNEGAQLYVRGPNTGLTKQDIADIKQAWNTKFNTARAAAEYLEFEDKGLEDPDSMDRLTVVVADKIAQEINPSTTAGTTASLIFYEGQLDGRRSVGVEVGEPEKLVFVKQTPGTQPALSEGESRLGSGFGFAAIRHAKEVELQNSTLTLTGIGLTDQNYLLVSNGETGLAGEEVAVTLDAGSVLNLGLDNVTDSADAANESRGKGTLSTLVSNAGTVKVKNGDYTIKNWTNDAGELQIVSASGKATALTLGQISSDSGTTTLGATGTLILNTAEATESRLNKLVATGGNLVAFDGNYTIGHLETSGDMALEVSVEKNGALGSTLSIEDQAEVNANYTVLKTATLVFGTENTVADKVFTNTGKITLETGENLNKATLVVNKETHVAELSGDNAQYTQTAATLISDKGWFTNSTLNISGGYIDAANIKDSEGHSKTDASGKVIGDLGSNTYIIGSTAAVTLPSTGHTPHDPWTDGNWVNRDDIFARVTTDTITSETTIRLKNGGLLQVINMKLGADEDGTLIATTPSIYLEGGVLETTSDQFFASWNYQSTKPIYKEEEDKVLGEPGVQYGKGEVYDPIIANLAGLAGKTGTIVLTDDRLFFDAAESIVQGIQEHSSFDNNNNIHIEFSGHILGEFTVDEAHKFMDSVQPTHSVIFDKLTLANKVDGISKNILRIGNDKNADPNMNRMKIDTALGFTKVTDATEVSVNDNKHFVLIGEQSDWDDQGWSSFEDINHERDAVRFNADNALLPDAQPGQGKLVVGSASGVDNPTSLTLGSSYTEKPSMGWVDRLEVGQGAQFNARNGEYALWTIKNANGHFNVEKDAYVHTRGTVDPGIGRGEWNIYGQLHFAKDQEIGSDASDQLNLATADLTGTLNNYGIVDGSLPSQLTLNGTANNFAGAEIRTYAGAANGTINNYGASVDEEGNTLAAAVFKQVKREGADSTPDSQQLFRLHGTNTVFNNQGEAEFINLGVESGSTFNNEASFKVSDSLAVSGGLFHQRGDAIESEADLNLSSQGQYINHAGRESNFANVTISPKAGSETNSAVIDNYGQFEVAQDFENSGTFYNRAQNTASGEVSEKNASMKVQEGNFSQAGGNFINENGTELVVAKGLTKLEALVSTDEEGNVLSSDKSKLDNRGSVVVQDVQASGFSEIVNGYSTKAPNTASAVRFDARNMSFDSAYLSNYAGSTAAAGAVEQVGLNANSAIFKGNADEEKIDTLFKNQGTANFVSGLTLSNAAAENKKGANVNHAVLTTSKLNLEGEFSRLDNQDMASVGETQISGEAAILNGSSARSINKSASLTGSFITNKQIADEESQAATLTLANEGSVVLSGEINIFGGLDIDNSIAVRTSAEKPASIQASSLSFRKDGDRASNIDNYGDMIFTGKDGKGVYAEGLTIKNGSSAKRIGTFTGPYLTLKGSSFDNYNLADFRTAAENADAKVQGVSLENSAFTNNGTSSTSNAKLYGKSLTLEAGSQLTNKGVADFRYSGEGYDKAGSVVVDASSVQTGVGSAWAEFYGSDLTVRNQAEDSDISFENQAKAVFSGDAQVNNSVVVTGTKNYRDSSKATFSAASLSMDNGKFVNGSEAVFATTLEGEEPVYGNVTAFNGSEIANGLNFELRSEDEAAHIADSRALNLNAVMKGAALTLGKHTEGEADNSRFINVGTAQFTGDVLATDGSHISNVILAGSRNANPSLSGLGLTLDHASDLTNNGSAAFDGSVLIDNQSFVENKSLSGTTDPVAHLTGHDLTLNEGSYLTNNGSAVFAANEAGVGTGLISAAAGSYVENTTTVKAGSSGDQRAVLKGSGLTLTENSYLNNSGVSDFVREDGTGGVITADDHSYINNHSLSANLQAQLTGSKITLSDHSFLNNTGSAIFSGEAADAGNITAEKNSYITNTTEFAAKPAELTGAKLTLSDGSYLKNTGGKVTLSKDIEATDSCVENLSEASLGLAQLTASAMGIHGSEAANTHFTNTGSAIFGTTETVTGEDGSESEVFSRGKITASFTDFLNGAVKGEDGEITKTAGISGIVLKSGDIELNTGSFGNYASVDAENIDLTNANLHNDTDASVVFTDRFTVLADGKSVNRGSIAGNDLFELTALNPDGERAVLENDGSGSVAGASINVKRFVAGDNSKVDSTKTTIVANESTTVGGDFALKAGSSLDTGKLTAAANLAENADNYLFDLQDSDVWAKSARLDSDLSIDKTSVFTVGIRKPADNPARSIARAAGTDSGEEDSAVFTGKITNKGKIVTYVDVEQTGSVNSDGALAGGIEILGGDVNYTARDVINTAYIRGENVTFNQLDNAHVTIAGADSADGWNWLNNSTVNISEGNMNANELGTNGKLGDNVYNVAYAPTSARRPNPDMIDPIAGTDGRYVSWGILDKDWKENSHQVVLYANSVSREECTVVNVYSGGVFSVGHIQLDTENHDSAFINLKGGALETTLGQIFAGERYQDVIGVDEPHPKDPSSLVEEYTKLKDGVISSISTDAAPADSSFFVFTDNNVLVSTAVSVVQLLQDAGYNASVAFSGTNYASFNIDQANTLQSAVKSTGDPLNYRVIFTDTVLDNTTVADGAANRTMIVGTKNTEPVEGANILEAGNFGLGFKAVSNADTVHIQKGILYGADGEVRESGNQFVLIGSKATNIVSDYVFGKSHEEGGPLDSELFNDQTKLLIDAADGGLVTVGQESILSLGSPYAMGEDDRSLGWINKVEMSDKAQIWVRKGEFALWDLSGTGQNNIAITDDAILHTDWIKGAADVLNSNILYVEKSSGTVFNGSVDNRGVFDTRGETVLGEDGERVTHENTFTFSGALADEDGVARYNLWNQADSSSIHDKLVLEDGAKVLNDGSFEGKSLIVNDGTSVANNGTSSWNATVIDGTYTNKGSLALGEETHAVGVDGLLDNYKDLTASGAISVDGVLNNHAGAQAQSSSSLTVNGNGLINNNSAMVFDAVKLAGLAEGDGLGTRFLNNNAVGEDGSVVSAAMLDARSLEVLGTFDNDGRVTIKDKVIAAPEGSDEEPTVVAGNFALNGGSINNRGVFDVSGVADNKIETGIFDNTGRLIASDMVQEDGTVTNSGAGTVRADSWTMNEGSFTNEASNYTKSEDGSLENVDVAIKGDFTQNGGTASNAGAMLAKNLSLLDKAVSFVNEGVRSLLGIQENVTQESGSVTNDGTILAGEFNEDGTPALDENGKPKSGNWTISDKAAGLTNTSTDSSATLSGDITQSSGKVTNNGAISAGNWTVTANASTEEGAVPTEGIANQGAASNIALRGDLSQGAGSFLNEGTVTVGGNCSITDETTAVDNTVAADQKALEKPFQPTITVGGDITQTAAAKTRNEGAITAGNWTIGGNSAGLDNVIADGLTAENGKPTVTLSGNLTGSSGFITNDGTITAGLFNEDGSPVLNEEGKPVAGNWTMSDKAAGLTNTLTDSSVILSGDITQSSGKVINNGAISAGNWTVTANTSTEEGAVLTEGIANVGAASNIALRGDLSQGAGSFLNEGTVKVGGNWSVTDETAVVNNTVAADQKGLDKPFQPTITVGGDITQTAPAKTTNEGAITAGNWTIGGTSAGLDNVIADGLTGENGKPTVTLSGSLTQSSGNFRNEGEVSIAGDWIEAGSVRTIDNVKNATAENPAIPTVTVGGDILQQHGFVTNEGKIQAGYDKSGNAVEGKGNWTIDGITRGFANKGAESEIKLAGDLTQLFGHGQNDGTITADDYTIGSLGEDAGEFAGAGAAGLTNLGTVELRGSITESSGNVVNEGKIQAGFDSNGNAVEGKGDWTVSDMSGGFENKGASSQIILSGNLTQASGFASNEGEISVGFDKDGNALEGKGNWTINDKSTGFANQGAASSIKLAGDFTQSVGDGLNEGEFTAHNYTMDGIASGLNNKATTNGDGTVNTPSVTLTGSITQSSGMVNNEGTITAGYGAEADKGDWSFSGTAEGLANIGADTTVTLAGNISQASGFVSNDGRMTVGFDKEGTAIAGKGNWDINAPSATGFSNNLETSEIKLAGSISQEVGQATNKGLITAHDWTVTGSADGINNLGEKSRVELTGNLAQLHGDIVNEGSMIGVGSDGQPGADNTYTAAGSNTNTGVFIFKGDMTQTDGDITNSRVGGGLPNGGDNFGTFMVGSITKSGGSIENSALFIANGDVTQTAGSITNKDGGFMNLNGDLTASEGPVSNLGVGSVINTGKAVFESAGAAIATPVTNEGTINLESAKFALGSSLDNTGTINFKDFVSFDNMDKYRNDGKILETVDPDRTERTKVSIGDSIIFATSGEIKADVLEIGSDTPYSAEDNSRNTFKTADFGKDNTQLHVGKDAAFTLNGEKPTDVFKLGSTTVASNEGTITLNNVTANNDGYLDNAGGLININSGTTFKNNSLAAEDQSGGITGGSVVIDKNAHLINQGTLKVENLSSANSRADVYDANGIISDENDAERAHFHQVSGALEVTDNWLNNSNIYVEAGASIKVEEPPAGTFRSLGEGNLYVLRSDIYNKDDYSDIIRIYGPNEERPEGDHRLAIGEDAYRKNYVRFEVDSVDLGGSNAFKLESGGTLVVKSLPSAAVNADSRHTIIMKGGAVETNLSQIFKDYPLGVGAVKTPVQQTINFNDGFGFFVFNDENYTLYDVKTSVRNINRLTGGSNSFGIAFTGMLGEKNELLVSDAHSLKYLDEEDKAPVYAFEGATLGNDRFANTKAGLNNDIEAIRVGAIGANEDDESGYSIEDTILVKNVGKAQTTEERYEALALSIEDGKSFAFGGYGKSELTEPDNPYSEESRLFKVPEEGPEGVEGGLVHVKNGTFGLGGISFDQIDPETGEVKKAVITSASLLQERARGWIGQVLLEKDGQMQVYEGDFAVKDLRNQGLLTVNENTNFRMGHYEDAAAEGSDISQLLKGEKGIVNRGTLILEEGSEDLVINSALINHFNTNVIGPVKTITVNGVLVNEKSLSAGDSLEKMVVNGYMEDSGSLFNTAENVNLKNLVVKDGGIVNNLNSHEQESLNVESGGVYNVGSVRYVEHRSEDGTLDHIEKQVNPASAKWTQTELDGALRIAAGSAFEALSDESGALQTTFGGTGYIVNAGTLDLTNVDKATIGHIYNEDDAPEIENATRAAGTVRFNELTITAVSGEPKGSADHPAVADKISFNPEAGEVFGRILNVESAHNFINKGAVTLEESLNLKDSNRFDNSGALTAKETINLGSSHALNNSGVIRTQRLNQGGFEAALEGETEPKSLGGSVVNTNEIYTAELSQGIGSSLVNKGYIRFSASPLDAVRESTENYIEKKKANVGLEVSPETVFVVKGDITNEHIIDASAVDKTYIGGADKENYFRTQYGAVSVFNDLEVNGKGQVINSGTDIGQYLTVNKDAKYTVDATGVSLWTDVFVIEGELEVIKGGTLTVQRDQGASVSTYSNALVPENAEVHGKFKNHGLSRFHNLTLKEKSESHNNGNIVGGHLLQEKNAGIHTTSEISNSTWEVVEINEGLENAGTRL